MLGAKRRDSGRDAGAQTRGGASVGPSTGVNGPLRVARGCGSACCSRGSQARLRTWTSLCLRPYLVITGHSSGVPRPSPRPAQVVLHAVAWSMDALGTEVEPEHQGPCSRGLGEKQLLSEQAGDVLCIQQIPVVRLLWARHCAGPWGCSSEQSTEPLPSALHSSGGG